MIRPLPHPLLAAAASVGFAWIVATFRCCDGEDGFARNTTVLASVAIGMFVVATLVFRVEPGRTIRDGLRIITMWGIAVAAILLARPPWDIFVHGGDTALPWRTAAVFVSTWIVSAAVDRRFNRR